MEDLARKREEFERQWADKSECTRVVSDPTKALSRAMDIVREFNDLYREYCCCPCCCGYDYKEDNEDDHEDS